MMEVGSEGSSPQLKEQNMVSELVFALGYLKHQMKVFAQIVLY
jgi:hypothetical protein